MGHICKYVRCTAQTRCYVPPLVSRRLKFIVTECPFTFRSMSSALSTSWWRAERTEHVTSGQMS